ncbi:MAG: hypothetical protein IT288_10190 [Bdellovibrionales bacterium]|nr:hypothetical protein [Bdellovibrionales bacterium]
MAPESPPKLRSRRMQIALMVFWRGLFLGVFLIGLLCVFHPVIRDYLRGIFHPPFRTILSSATGPYLPEFPISRVLKVRTHEGLFVEVYGQNEGEARPLIDRIRLPDRRDAFFSFSGRTSNLFLHDVSGDGVPEIIAPSFDDDLIAHLNVFRLNQGSQKLENVPGQPIR